MLPSAETFLPLARRLVRSTPIEREAVEEEALSLAYALAEVATLRLEELS